MAVREKGDWEGWIKFFLRGVSFTSDEATGAAKEIIELKTKCEKLIANKGYSTVYSIFLDELFKHPVISKNNLTDILGVSYPTVSKIVDDFCADNILQDITPE